MRCIDRKLAVGVDVFDVVEMVKRITRREFEVL